MVVSTAKKEKQRPKFKVNKTIVAAAKPVF